MTPDLVTTAPFADLRMHAGAAPGGGFNRRPAPRLGRSGPGTRRAGKEVYLYFNNDREGHAVRDALRLRALLGSD